VGQQQRQQQLVTKVLLHLSCPAAAEAIDRLCCGDWAAVDDGDPLLRPMLL